MFNKYYKLDHVASPHFHEQYVDIVGSDNILYMIIKLQNKKKNIILK